MVIDFEHHYIPAELGRRFGMDPNRKDAVRTGDASIHSQLFDLPAQIADMDCAGIDVAVQSCILGWDTTLENCQLLNDCTARAQKDFPGRFVGLAHVPPLDGEAALAGTRFACEVAALTCARVGALPPLRSELSQ